MPRRTQQKVFMCTVFKTFNSKFLLRHFSASRRQNVPQHEVCRLFSINLGARSQVEPRKPYQPVVKPSARVCELGTQTVSAMPHTPGKHSSRSPSLGPGAGSWVIPCQVCFIPCVFQRKKQWEVWTWSRLSVGCGPGPCGEAPMLRLTQGSCCLLAFLHIHTPARSRRTGKWQEEEHADYGLPGLRCFLLGASALKTQWSSMWPGGWFWALWVRGPLPVLVPVDSMVWGGRALS